MASFGRQGSDVVVDMAVFRGLVDLMLQCPDLDDAAVRLLTQERDVGALTLDLIQPPVREQLESALAWACANAKTGDPSTPANDDVADRERLIEGADAVRTLFAGPAPSPGAPHRPRP